MINTQLKCSRLPHTTKLDNARVRIILAILNHAFASSCDSHNEFKNILNRAHGKEDELKLDEETIKSHDLSRFFE